MLRCVPIQRNILLRSLPRAHRWSTEKPAHEAEGTTEMPKEAEANKLKLDREMGVEPSNRVMYNRYN